MFHRPPLDDYGKQIVLKRKKEEERCPVNDPLFSFPDDTEEIWPLQTNVGSNQQS